MNEMSADEKIRLLRVWLNHYKVHRHFLNKNEKKAFLRKFMTMGKELLGILSDLKALRHYKRILDNNQKEIQSK